MRIKKLAAAILALAVAAPLALAQKKSPVSGSWELKVAGQTYRMELVDEDGDVTGTVTLPSGETAEVEYGLAFGKELEFSTVENGVEYEWTADVSRNSIKGERFHLDDETTVKFTGRRSR